MLLNNALVPTTEGVVSVMFSAFVVGLAMGRGVVPVWDWNAGRPGKASKIAGEATIDQTSLPRDFVLFSPKAVNTTDPDEPSQLRFR